jgi:hypothetical protein
MGVAGDSDGDDAFGGDEGGVFEQTALIHHSVNEFFGFELKTSQSRLFDISSTKVTRFSFPK